MHRIGERKAPAEGFYGTAIAPDGWHASCKIVFASIPPTSGITEQGKEMDMRRFLHATAAAGGCLLGIAPAFADIAHLYDAISKSGAPAHGEVLSSDQLGSSAIRCAGQARYVTDS